MSGSISQAQRCALIALLEADEPSLSLKELEARVKARTKAKTNPGAIARALGGFSEFQVVVEDGRAAILVAEDRPFSDYDASGLGPRLRRNRQLKEAAGRGAAELLVRALSTNSSVILDNGTQQAWLFRAFMKACKNLPDEHRPGVTFRLLNPAVAAEALRFGVLGDVTVIGGELNLPKCSFEGSDVAAAIERVPFDVAVIGIARATSDGRLGQPGPTMIVQKETMFRRASHGVVVLDASKILDVCGEGSYELFGDLAETDPKTTTIARILALRRDLKLTFVVAMSGDDVQDGHAWDFVDYARSGAPLPPNDPAPDRLQVHVVDLAGSPIHSDRSSDR